MINSGELYRAELFDNKTPRLTIDQLYAKNKDKYADCDCYVFNFHWQNGDGSYCGNYRVNGVTLSEEYTDCLGFGWSGNEKPVMGWWSKLKGKDNFVCTMPMIYGGKKQDVSAAKYTSFVVRSCSRIAVGFDAEKCYIFANEVMTAEALRDKGAEMGLTDMLGGDSGGSTKIRGPGISYDNSDRFIYNYMVVWLKKGGGTTSKYKVCLDAGHGGNEVSNGSPDGTYKEHEFTLDMAKRVRDLISPYVDVVMTREDNVTVSLTERATIANNASADIFVSMHSNASGSGWTDANGLTIWTYAAGGNRDVLANKLLDRFGEIGITLFGDKLYHNKFTVLANSNMPAVLIEYLFHNNKADAELLKSTYWRDEAAIATAKGILDYLGIEYKAQDTAKPTAERAAQELINAGYGDILIALANKI